MLMILPPGHASEANRTRKLGPRERRFAIFGAVVTGLLLIVVVIAVAIPGQKAGKGCLDLNIPSSTGAQPINACGQEAREICSTLNTPAGYTGRLASEYFGPACRKIGLRVG
jgi:hypothetical protein